MYRLPFMRLQVCCWICNQTGTENRGKVKIYFRPQNEFSFLVMMVDHEGGAWSIRGCRASARARVALSIVSEDLTAQAITQGTGLEPTDSWSRGDLRTHPRMRHLGPHAFTRWTLCPEGDLRSEFEDKLTRLLQLTEPAAARIRALADTCDVSILVGYGGYTDQFEAFRLNPETWRASLPWAPRWMSTSTLRDQRCPDRLICAPDSKLRSA
ncbi:hypothetical protein GCM10017782_30030 [Deinococcus ficus]|nr:hypothetical protein GCM10017782_30030 [Deinococcus ficus]